MQKLLICIVLSFAVVLSQNNTVTVVNHPVGVAGNQDCSSYSLCQDMLSTNGHFTQNDSCQHNSYLWSALWWQTGLPVNASFNGWNITGTCAQLKYGGTVDPGTVSGTAQDSVTLNFNPSNTFSVYDVQVNGVSVGSQNSLTFDSVQAPFTVDVTFYNSQAGPTFAITAADDGIININPSLVSVHAQGANVTHVFTPANENCFVLNVNIDGQDLGPMNQFTFTNLSEHHTITVTGMCSYKISAVPSNTDCKIYPSGINYVNASDSISYHIDPPANKTQWEVCTIGAVTVDGWAYGAGLTDYTFTNVNAPHTITADCYCVPVNFEVKVQSSSCVATPLAPIMVVYGGSVNITFVSQCGNGDVYSLSLNGQTQQNDNTLLVSNVWSTQYVNVECACNKLAQCPPETYAHSNTYDARYNGKQVAFNNAVYLYQYWNKNQAPVYGATYGPWLFQGDCLVGQGFGIYCNNVSQWSGSGSYSSGQQVLFQGQLYTALSWVNVRPDDKSASNQWNSNGSC